MRRIRNLCWLTAFLVLFLVSVGGFVRVAGAGLGCPDWPLCWGRWIPPTSVEQIPPDIDASQFNFTRAWIEYVNRLVGVVIGLASLVTLVATWRGARSRRGVFGSVVAAFVLIGFQGWFGSLVVSHELDPRFVSVHMVLAMLVIACLVWAALHAEDNEPQRVTPAALGIDVWTSRILNGFLALSVLQFLVGALVRGGIENIAKDNPDLSRSDWLSEVGVLDYVHREVGLVTILLAALLWRRRGCFASLTDRRIVLVGTLLAAGQIAAGLVLAYCGLPAAFQLIHLTLAAWLFAAAFLLWARLRLKEGDSA